MLYPTVREISRAGQLTEHRIRTQRDLVALSLRLRHEARTVRPIIWRDPPSGIAR